MVTAPKNRHKNNAKKKKVEELLKDIEDLLNHIIFRLREDPTHYKAKPRRRQLHDDDYSLFPEEEEEDT